MEFVLARIRVADDGDLGGLQDWLAGDSGLRGRVRRERQPPNPGEMGALSDVLVAALGDGGAVAALAGGLATWLATRRSKATIEVTGPDGRGVKLSNVSAAKAEALLREILPIAALPQPADQPALPEPRDGAAREEAP